MNKIVLGLLAVLSLVSANSHAAVVGEEVQYKVGDTSFKGYLAYDNSSSAKRPGVLVVHEWWGQNDYARKRARMLAELGYTALALDMYGDGKQASHPKEAGAFSGAVKSNMPVAKERFLAAKKVLSEFKFTDPSRIAAIGYCFGGGIVLEMARMGVDLKSVVSFHGSLGTANPAKKGEVKAKVLVLNGAADPFTKPEQIQAFKQEMSNAGVDYRFINYPDAMHAFTNPAATETGKKFGIPLAYNKKADKQSWKEMKKFLKATLK
ncbi:MAG: dienelactone hydrolase family protein [Acidiferrobacterales bacterium]|jgi:dienelactone hydrolase|nr:dienelactone hydrolase family protein [Acidiferrobacterales bacterium]